MPLVEQEAVVEEEGSHCLVEVRDLGQHPTSPLGRPPCLEPPEKDETSVDKENDENGGASGYGHFWRTLKSAVQRHNPLRVIKIRGQGLEPWTNWLKANCSTN